MQEIGAYIHIPFCIKKCYYCDFISYENEMQKVDDYIECLKKEIQNEKNKRTIDTIYIGGGTPSSIQSKYIKEILETLNKKFSIEKNAEITIEVNPATVDKEKLENYLKMGINRLSIGMQSCNNKTLKKIGRIHNYNQFLETYNLARKVGFKNINIDVIIGLPDQKIEDMEEIIEQVKVLNPEHISVYSLIIEEGTILEEKVKKQEEILPQEDEERKMYWYMKKSLENIGYTHYEISNYAKFGLHSKHNLNCWNQREYIGFGLAAHSYINNTRYSNTQEIDKYIENIKKGSFEKNRQIHEKQNKKDQMKEYILLGLRKIEGVSVTDFKNKFIVNPIYEYMKVWDKLVKEGLVIIDEDNIKLTNKGIDLANIVWQEFI